MAARIITIMGATGNIGHVLTQKLLKRGHKVRAIGRNPEKKRLLQEQGAQCMACDIMQADSLTQATKGSDALFALIPPNPKEPGDYISYEEKVIRNIINSVEKNKIPFVLSLSSVGAELPEHTGPVKGLHKLEKALNEIQNLNVLHLRAAFFMNNLLLLMQVIKKYGYLGGALRGDLPIPMVATKDIGEKAAEFLDKLNFTGSQIFDFEGPKLVTPAEAAQIIGKIIGKPNLKYQQFAYDKMEAELISLGVTPNFAKLLMEMDKSFNENKIKSTQKITNEHKGKTTLETFFNEALSEKYQAAIH